MRWRAVLISPHRPISRPAYRLNTQAGGLCAQGGPGSLEHDALFAKEILNCSGHSSGHVVAVVCFKSHGRPASSDLNEYTTTAQWEAWGEELGLKRPIVVQYVDWIADSMKGLTSEVPRSKGSLPVGIALEYATETPSTWRPCGRQSSSRALTILAIAVISVNGTESRLHRTYGESHSPGHPTIPTRESSWPHISIQDAWFCTNLSLGKLGVHAAIRNFGHIMAYLWGL